MMLDVPELALILPRMMDVDSSFMGQKSYSWIGDCSKARHPEDLEQQKEW